MTRSLSTVLQKSQEVAESWALKLVHGKHLPLRNFISLEIVVNGVSTQAAPVVYHISIHREDLVYQLQLVNDVIVNVTTLSVGTFTLMAFSAVEDKGR